MERDVPAVLARGLRVGGKERLGVLRDAGEAAVVIEREIPRVGGVKEVFAELLAQHRKAFAHGLDAGALGLGQFGAREAEVAELALDDATANG